MITVIVKHYVSTRPVDHPGRVRCLEFARGIDTAGLDQVVTVVLGKLLPVGDAYEAARIDNETAASTVDDDIVDVGTASGAFGHAFDRWTIGIDRANDAKGYADRTLRPELGGMTVNAFLASPDWDKVARMTTVFAHVAVTPALAGDPADLAGLKKATTRLKKALTIRNDTAGDRSDTSKALVAATRAFDRAYGLLLDAMEDHAPDLHAKAPRFPRTRNVKVLSADPDPAEVPADLPAETSELSDG
jgi:hypothetical protein